MPRTIYFILVAVVEIYATIVPSCSNLSAAQDRPFHFAKGKPEHLLSGIDISGKIEQVIAKYGKPDEVRNVTVEETPEGTGEKDYIWKKGLTTTSVITGHYMDSAGKMIESETYEIEVTGRSSEGEIGKTGAGLSLGDTREAANRLYGAHFYDSQVYKSPLRGNHALVLATEWENGTRLCLAFDKQGRINFITLMAPVD